MADLPKQFDDLNASMRIVILHGPDEFLRREATRRLRELLEAEHGGTAVGRVTFDGETAEPADVLDELRTFGLFREHKLVVVDKADRFLAGGAKSGEDDDDGGATGSGAQRRRALEAYAADPSRGATLVLRAEGWRPGRLDKAVAKVGAVIRCGPLKDREAVSWAFETCPQRHGLVLSRPAAQLLVGRLGPSLGRLDTELAKLAAFVGPGHEIGLKDVQGLVGKSREEKAWELQTAIMTGGPDAACVKLRELVDISQLDPVLITWAVSDLLRKLHTVAQLSRQGGGGRSLTKPPRLWGATGDRIIEVARRTDPDVFARLLEQAVRADMVNKNSRSKPARIRNLESLTLQVTDTIWGL